MKFIGIEPIEEIVYLYNKLPLCVSKGMNMFKTWCYTVALIFLLYSVKDKLLGTALSLLLEG